MTSKKVFYDIPTDPAVLMAVGKVTICHGQLDDVLRMTYKILVQISPSEARRALARDGARQLRERVRKLAHRELGEGAPLAKLQSMLVECEVLTERRNSLVHGLWAKELDGDAHIRDHHGRVEPQPTAEELERLAGDIVELRDRFNKARLDGFLGEALTARRASSP